MLLCIRYLLTQFAGSYLSVRYGAKAVLAIGVLGSAVFNIATPLALHHSAGLGILLRAISGFFEGVMFPSLNVLMSRWAPPQERSRLTGIVFSGPCLGSFAALPLWGYLCEDGGDWARVFYFGGGAGVVWVLLWVLFAGE